MSASAIFSCPTCKRLYPWKSPQAGHHAKCKCGHVFIVPAAPDFEPSEPSAPPAPLAAPTPQVTAPATPPTPEPAATTATAELPASAQPPESAALPEPPTPRAQKWYSPTPLKLLTAASLFLILLAAVLFFFPNITSRTSTPEPTRSIPTGFRPRAGTGLP